MPTKHRFILFFFNFNLRKQRRRQILWVHIFPLVLWSV